MRAIASLGKLGVAVDKKANDRMFIAQNNRNFNALDAGDKLNLVPLAKAI
ncbi:hypothetical protein [Bradyrhizobium sp. NP1]|nr:hypothetical protein [Bradyrhizobium sp. NP1]WJR75033.1 hypothetical protein QOU61_19640 [Bradyrhizobium sp. NP1]